jgi:hypothetical protein
MKWITMQMTIVLALVGCEGAEERCNIARIDASDAWTPVAETLVPRCTLFEMPEWALARQDAGRVGQRTRWAEVVAVELAACVDEYSPVLRNACVTIPAARARATGGAVAAREASHDADQALERLLAAAPAFAACLTRIEEHAVDSESRDRMAPLLLAARAHTEAIDGGGLGTLRSASLAASEASFAACQAVDP